MAGPACVVYGRGALTENRLMDIDKLLESKCSILTRTRKGRVWDVEMHRHPVHIWIEEISDEDVPQDAHADWDDEVTAAGLLPEDAPFRVALSAGLNSGIDYGVLKALSRPLATLLGGPATEPTK